MLHAKIRDCNTDSTKNEKLLFPCVRHEGNKVATGRPAEA